MAGESGKHLENLLYNLFGFASITNMRGYKAVPVLFCSLIERFESERRTAQQLPHMLAARTVDAKSFDDDVGELGTAHRIPG